MHRRSITISAIKQDDGPLAFALGTGVVAHLPRAQVPGKNARRNPAEGMPTNIVLRRFLSLLQSIL